MNYTKKIIFLILNALSLRQKIIGDREILQEF